MFAPALRHQPVLPPFQKPELASSASISNHLATNFAISHDLPATGLARRPPSYTVSALCSQVRQPPVSDPVLRQTPRRATMVDLAATMPPGFLFAGTNRQRDVLRELHRQFKELLLIPANDVHENRNAGLVLIHCVVEAKQTTRRLMLPEYQDAMLNYGVQALRKLGLTVQKHFGVQDPSTITPKVWEGSTTERLRPDPSAPVIEKWRWAIRYHLDMLVNKSLAPGVADTVLKLCFLDEPTNLKFHVGGDYPLGPLDLQDEELKGWKEELLEYAASTLAMLANVLAHNFKGKEVKVLGFTAKEEG